MTKPAKRVRELHRSAHYLAHYIDGPHGGIVVKSNRTDTGVFMPSDHPQFAGYLEGFEDETADTKERDALCRALLTN